MQFNSIFFFLTLIPLIVTYALAKSKRSPLLKALTIGYGYFFYGMWNPYFVLLLFASTLIDFYSGIFIERYPAKKTFFLGASLVTNLGSLAFFKYYNFFMDTSFRLVNLIGVNGDPPFLKIVLPVGISFYTFQALSYTIEVYRGNLKAERNFLDIALFISFFPHLVAGPILRASNFLPQQHRDYTFNQDRIAHAFLLIFIGLFFKVVIADNVATKVDFLFENWATNSMIQTWQAAMLFSVQIYGDFNGYTLTAIGLACMLGFTLPENFNAPYGAIGFTDFWRRWHISLSSWIRDYLYIPLGGSRKGKVRTYANLLISMALCGLWHGASFMFLLWGGIHGLFLCIERLLRSTMDFEIKRPFIRQAFSLAAIILTYLAVCFAWIPFRARTFEQCITMMRTMILGNSHSSGSSLSMWPIIIIIFGSHLISRKFDIIGEIERRKPLIFMCILSIFLSLFYFSGTKSEFIYFQF